MQIADDQKMAADRRCAVEDTLREFARDATMEVTPARINGGPPLSRLLVPGTRVYVPFLPQAALADTVAACRCLVAEDLVPVPHFAARAMESRDDASRFLAALNEAGVRSLQLIAGDRRTPAGPFRDTLDVFESGILLEHGFRRIGVSGYPDGHPAVSREQLDRALAAKCDYAARTGSELWIVTQFVFSSQTTIDWLERLQQASVPLPVYIGVPGPTKLKTLIAYAAQCGVSVSARLLRKKPNAARLVTAWTPDGLLRDLALHRASAVPSPLSGIHLFPFGGIERAVGWLGSLAGTSLVDETPGARQS